MGSALPETIHSAVDQSRFLDHLREMFTKRSVVLGELMQNARRAGATYVSFEFSDGNLVVVDDGCGVADFQLLVTIAGSGWSPELMAAERPFGIGFASTAFSAASVLIESRNCSINFSAQNLIEEDRIPVERSLWASGTRITLAGIKLSKPEIARELQELAMGFPIEVRFNGTCLANPHARHALIGTETPVGFVHVPGIHLGTERDTSAKWIYCQGLPIDRMSGSRYGYRDPDGAVVVHVDPLRFRPRCPDRDVFIDHREASEAINQAVDDLWKARLLDRKPLLDAAAFAETYWAIAQRHGCWDLMADVAYLPRAAIVHISEYPVVCADGESFVSPPDAGLAMEEVVRGAALLVQPEICDLEKDGFARMLYAQAKGAFFVDQLPPGHWATPHILDLLQADLQIVGTVIAREEFSGRYGYGEIRAYESLSVVVNGDAVSLRDPVAIAPDDDPYEPALLLVPKDCDDPSRVLRQVSDYVDDKGSHQETDLAEDRQDFDNQFSVLCGEAPALTLRKCLTQGGAFARTNLRGRRFVVSLDVEGKLSVVEEPVREGAQ